MRLLSLSVSWILRALVLAYRYGLSPVLGVNCRYEPSCSAYALEAIASHGPLTGGWLSIKRIGRCHPWGGSGYDPVPAVHGCDRVDGRAHSANLTEQPKG